MAQDDVARRLMTLAGLVEKVRDTGAMLTPDDARLLHEDLMCCADAVRCIQASAAPCLPPALGLAASLAEGADR